MLMGVAATPHPSLSISILPPPPSQVQVRLRPYTWAHMLLRTRQRRSFVHLHKKVLRRGYWSLSELERMSLAQLTEALSAADIILFEQLAEAQLMVTEEGEVASEGGWLFSKRPASPAHIAEEHASMPIEMSAEQRSALPLLPMRPSLGSPYSH